MKDLVKENDKIQSICDALKKQTIEPAQVQATKIIADAKAFAEQIITTAQQQAKELIRESNIRMEQEQNIFRSALSQSSKQSLELLKQTIEQELFNPELQNLITKHTSDAPVVAKLIACIVNAIDKEGLNVELSAYIPSTISPREVNALIGKEILNKLKNQSVELGNFGGGVKVRLEGKNMTFDLSDSTLKDLLQKYVRKDFRSLMFTDGTANL